jgi:hypothetical protein
LNIPLWKTDRTILLDGTKVNGAEESITSLQLRIDDADVVALFETLIEEKSYAEYFGRIASKLLNKLNTLAKRADEMKALTEQVNRLAWAFDPDKPAEQRIEEIRSLTE